MEHAFAGKWISNKTLANLKPRNVFFRQLDNVKLDCTQNRNQHVLFRREFNVDSAFKCAKIYISADDYYKLYINGKFVGQGPAPSYHFSYNYNEIDVSKYLVEGKNLIAVHTLYQGLINRVWQSGDNRHGLIMDLVVDGKTVVYSDQSFKTKTHGAYSETGTCGYQTQFLERYDGNAKEVGFFLADFDDSCWEKASVCVFDDHKLVLQQSKSLVFEVVKPKKTEKKNNAVIYDFGSNYVGYLEICANGKKGDKVTIRCAQELNEDGSIRYQLRANCTYEEEWVLKDGQNQLDQFDYKAFRYAEISYPDGVEIVSAQFFVRHYPFKLKAKLKPEYAKDKDLKRIWDLCINTQKYGVQEVIQDCMEREKGFYLGDGCYTALTHMLLTGDDSMVRKLIDDAFSTSFITPTLVTCMCCSFIQEIAEYPLILVELVLWHYNYTGDKEYLAKNFINVKALLDAYRKEYEKECLLRDLDKWCVVEWPQNFRHGYDVDITEGVVCKQAHVSINAYYIYAIKTANKIASVLGEQKYRNENELVNAFNKAFFDDEKQLYKDGENTDHVSLVGNSFAYAFGFCPSENYKENVLKMIDENGIDSLSFFCTFPILMKFVIDGEDERLKTALTNKGTWKRMLNEDATTTFEGWGKETKWNTSLFHLTMSFASTFMADVDLKKIFN